MSFCINSEYKQIKMPEVQNTSSILKSIIIQKLSLSSRRANSQSLSAFSSSCSQNSSTIWR